MASKFGIKTERSLQDRGLAVLGTSRFLLLAVWATALSSISSAQKFQAELDNGTDPTKISTFYDIMSSFTSAAMIGTWIISGYWLKQATEQVQAAGRETKHSPRWALWSWVVPVVSLWFPYQMIKDVLPRDAKAFPQKDINTWWLTFLGFLLVNDYGLAISIQESAANPIHPTYELAGACLLTGSYFVWKRIVSTVSTTA
jgi:hypothetical protein